MHRNERNARLNKVERQFTAQSSNISTIFVLTNAKYERQMKEKVTKRPRISFHYAYTKK